MSKTVSEFRAALRVKRARAMGMTLAQFDAYVRAEGERIDVIRRATYDRMFALSAIIRRVHDRGHTWAVA